MKNNLEILFYNAVGFSPRVHNRRRTICAMILARLVRGLTGVRKPTLAGVKPLVVELPDEGVF